MKKKSRKILLAILILLFIPLIIYISNYIWESRSSMYMFDGLILDSDGVKVWAFGDTKQRLDLYLDSETNEYMSEMEYRKIYWPLIKVDRYIFHNYHILEEDLPYMGG